MMQSFMVLTKEQRLIREGEVIATRIKVTGNHCPVDEVSCDIASVVDWTLSFSSDDEDTIHFISQVLLAYHGFVENGGVIDFSK